MIDFEQVRFQILVKYDIEPEQLEAHGALPVSRLARPIVMKQVGLYAEHSLDYNIFDLQQQAVDIMASIPEPVHDCLEAALVALVVQGVLGVLELPIVFVDRVVCQVDKHIVDVRLVETARLKFLGSEAHYTFVVEEYLKGVAGCDEDVEPNVEFQVVYEIWVFQVLLDHYSFIGRVIVHLHYDIVHVVSQKDTLALR